MASANGRHDSPLIEALYGAPYGFDVRQAVRLLETLAPGSVSLAAGSDPRREAVRLRGSLTSSFPPSDIESLRPAHGDGRPEMTVTFMGLAGAFGPLPPPLTARVVARARKHDAAGRDFLDLFNHRLIALLLRQWQLMHPALQGDPARPAMPARLPLLALLGLATPPRNGRASGEGRLGPLVPSLFEAAGLLHPRPMSAHALERLLGGHFGVPTRVLPLRGDWLPLERAQWTRLGHPGAVLGRHAVVGRRVWDQAAGVWIELGPLGLALMEQLLPGQRAHLQATALLGVSLGNIYDVELVLILRAAEVPSSRLGKPPAGQQGTRLGWTSFLGTGSHTADRRVRVQLRPALDGHG
jgi:type VI secretion system protein ImpH